MLEVVFVVVQDAVPAFSDTSHHMRKIKIGVNTQSYIYVTMVGTIRFDDLGDPIKKLVKALKREVSDEEMHLLSTVTVMEMAKIYDMMGVDEDPEKIVSWLLKRAKDRVQVKEGPRQEVVEAEKAEREQIERDEQDARSEIRKDFSEIIETRLGNLKRLEAVEIQERNDVMREEDAGRKTLWRFIVLTLEATKKFRSLLSELEEEEAESRLAIEVEARKTWVTHLEQVDHEWRESAEFLEGCCRNPKYTLTRLQWFRLAILRDAKVDWSSCVMERTIEIPIAAEKRKTTPESHQKSEKGSAATPSVLYPTREAFIECLRKYSKLSDEKIVKWASLLGGAARQAVMSRFTVRVCLGGATTPSDSSSTSTSSTADFSEDLLQSTRAAATEPDIRLFLTHFKITTHTVKSLMAMPLDERVAVVKGLRQKYGELPQTSELYYKDEDFQRIRLIRFCDYYGMPMDRIELVLESARRGAIPGTAIEGRYQDMWGGLVANYGPEPLLSEARHGGVDADKKQLTSGRLVAHVTQRKNRAELIQLQRLRLINFYAFYNVSKTAEQLEGLVAKYASTLSFGTMWRLLISKYGPEPPPSAEMVRAFWKPSFLDADEVEVIAGQDGDLLTQSSSIALQHSVSEVTGEDETHAVETKHYFVFSAQARSVIEALSRITFSQRKRSEWSAEGWVLLAKYVGQLQRASNYQQMFSAAMLKDEFSPYKTATAAAVAGSTPDSDADTDEYDEVRCLCNSLTGWAAVDNTVRNVKPTLDDAVSSRWLMLAEALTRASQAGDQQSEAVATVDGKIFSIRQCLCQACSTATTINKVVRHAMYLLALQVNPDYNDQETLHLGKAGILQGICSIHFLEFLVKLRLKGEDAFAEDSETLGLLWKTLGDRCHRRIGYVTVAGEDYSVMECYLNAAKAERQYYIDVAKEMDPDDHVTFFEGSTSKIAAAAPVSTEQLVAQISMDGTEETQSMGKSQLQTLLTGLDAAESQHLDDEATAQGWALMWCLLVGGEAKDYVIHLPSSKDLVTVALCFKHCNPDQLRRWWFTVDEQTVAKFYAQRRQLITERNEGRSAIEGEEAEHRRQLRFLADALKQRHNTQVKERSAIEAAETKARKENLVQAEQAAFEGSVLMTYRQVATAYNEKMRKKFASAFEALIQEEESRRNIFVDNARDRMTFVRVLLQQRREIVVAESAEVLEDLCPVWIKLNRLNDIQRQEREDLEAEAFDTSELDEFDFLGWIEIMETYQKVTGEYNERIAKAFKQKFKNLEEEEARGRHRVTENTRIPYENLQSECKTSKQEVSVFLIQHGNRREDATGNQFLLEYRTGKVSVATAAQLNSKPGASPPPAAPPSAASTASSTLHPGADYLVRYLFGSSGTDQSKSSAVKPTQASSSAASAVGEGDIWALIYDRQKRLVRYLHRPSGLTFDNIHIALGIPQAMDEAIELAHKQNPSHSLWPCLVSLGVWMEVPSAAEDGTETFIYWNQDSNDSVESLEANWLHPAAARQLVAEQHAEQAKRSKPSKVFVDPQALDVLRREKSLSGAPSSVSPSPSRRIRPPPPPACFLKLFDAAWGAYYFQNLLTSETTWDDPPPGSNIYISQTDSAAATSWYQNERTQSQRWELPTQEELDARMAEFQAASLASPSSGNFVRQASVSVPDGVKPPKGLNLTERGSPMKIQRSLALECPSSSPQVPTPAAAPESPPAGEPHAVAVEGETDKPVFVQLKTAEGDLYFLNAKTGETTWDAPGPEAIVYVQLEDANGAGTYYWNQQDNSVRWELPAARAA